MTDLANDTNIETLDAQCSLDIQNTEKN